MNWSPDVPNWSRIVPGSILDSSGPDVAASLRLHIRHLDEQIKKLLKRITEVVEKNPSLKVKVSLLAQVHGIGTLMASALLATLPELGSLSKTRYRPWRDWLHSIEIVELLEASAPLTEGASGFDAPSTCLLSVPRAEIPCLRPSISA
jgi:hypothetical protein